jgi:hypothetical protein
MTLATNEVSQVIDFLVNLSWSHLYNCIRDGLIYHTLPEKEGRNDCSKTVILLTRKNSGSEVSVSPTFPDGVDWRFLFL